MCVKSKIWYLLSSVRSLSHVLHFGTPWTAAHQASLSFTNSQNLLKLMSINSVMHPSSVVPFSSCLQSFPASGSFPRSQFFTSGEQRGFSFSHQSFQWILRIEFLQDWLVGSSCSPRDSQESSPTPQFKSIVSLALSFLYSSTLTSIHDHWKIHSFD